MSIILGLYVKNVETTEKAIIFTVVSVITRIVYTVTRQEVDGFYEWTCKCSFVHRSNPDGSLQHCDHIARAELYHRNMMARVDQMKNQVKTMAANKTAERESLLLPNKRNIRLEDD